MYEALLKLRLILQTLFFSVALLCIPFPASLAQHYSFSDASNGLNNLDVDCAARDGEGFLWIGTENGLFRFDGDMHMRMGAAQGMPARMIQDIYIAPDGTMLVGAVGGIYVRQHNGLFAEVHMPDPVSQFILRIGTVFAASPAGQVLVADRGGVYQLRHDAASSWRAELFPLLGKHVSGLLFDAAGTLWYGCDDDLCRMSGGKSQRLGQSLHLPRDQWLNMKLDLHGHLWLRGVSHLEELDLAQGKAYGRDLPGGTGASNFDSLAIDTHGRILANHGPVFGIWESDHWHMVTPRNGLPGFYISSMIVDADGSLWLGFVGHGFQHWVGQDNWEAYTTNEGLSNEIVWDSVRDRSGRLWVATEDGLDWLAPGATQLQRWQSPGVNTKRPQALAEDRQGNIWAGTADGHLVRIDAQGRAGKSWQLPEIYNLFFDSANRLWIATAQGLYQYLPGQESPTLVHAPAFGPNNERFRSICQGPQGELWTSSEAAIYRLDGRGWTRIDAGLSGITPTHIAADRNGNLWGAGSFNGLIRLRISGSKITEVEHIQRPHLLSEQIVDLMVDSRGWLWVGQDAGLTVYNGSAWRSFTRNDGLIWNDVDSNGLNEDRDHSIWIGTSGGLAHLLHPEAANTPYLRKPQIVSASFGALPLENQASVRWSNASLRVQLASLNFHDNNRPHLRYRLLGLEDGWIDTEEESLLYHHLEPGHYIFQVKTVDLSTGAASAIAEYEFWIKPRWWQSWQLKMALLGSCLLLLYLIWRWRVQLLLWQKHQLQLAVLHRTQDLEAEKAELLRTREQLRHFAEHDDLTGLLNHRVIEDRLQGEIDRARRERSPLSLLMIDLDHFKKINDTYGHPAGDAMLREIGAVLLRSVRSYDWIGRYGGEEFLVILPGSGFMAARNRAEQIRMAIQSAIAVDGERNLQVTASIGVASGFPEDAQTILRAADNALYRAKHNGRNCVMALEVQKL